MSGWIAGRVSSMCSSGMVSWDGHAGQASLRWYVRFRAETAGEPVKSSLGLDHESAQQRCVAAAQGLLAVSD